MKRHLNIKSFKCNYNECDLSFVTLSQFKCHFDECNKKFVTFSQLNRYSKVHK